VLFAGHADAGTPEPVVHSETGTIIMQTYGQATHLGYLQLTLDPDTHEIKAYDGRLIPVDPALYEPDPAIVAKLTDYRNAYPEIREVIGQTAARMNRRYIEESDIGNLFADAFLAIAGTDVAFIHGGSLRKDLPQGEIRVVDLLDAYPFVDDVFVKEMSGAQIRRALEQSFTLERGLLQVAGLRITYDLSRPEGQRLVSVEYDGAPLADGEWLTVAAPGFLAEGGDLYTMFAESEPLRSAGKVTDVITEYFARQEIVEVPESGRQVDIAR
jgi:2',3'-cyclic-nucleotide 2'-phosphodiesterase (5'-nucleotidase family)